ncbi:MAG: hypothetical protein HY046_07070 [Acidobacteria bacterium]|nr:hypothetical protein [Acidobacteriota bacterium]
MKLGKKTTIVLACLALAGVAIAGASFSSGTTPVTLPAGTVITVRLDHTVASNQHRSGDTFDATVASPVVVKGRTVIPEGANAKGSIIDARESGRLSGVARLRLALNTVEVGNSEYDVSTSTVSRVGQNHKKRNWFLIGGGTGLGALIGGLAGGGKGLAIGAASGAGAGTAGAAVTGKREVRLPAESLLTFRLAEPLIVQVKS